MNEADVLPVLLGLQAKDLAGRSWKINDRTYRLAEYNGATFGGGRESIGIGLYDEQGRLTAYFKSFVGIFLSHKRVARTKWLIAADLPSLGPEFRGAPRQWLDTRQDGRPQGIIFDFTGYLMEAVPGMDWRDLKESIASGEPELSASFRKRCVEGLLRALAVLERRGILHGDISPNNLKVHLTAAEREPAVYLLDFDGFAAPSAGELGRLTTDEGGVFGTEGYCPPDLSAESENERHNVAPYSDRYGRDMLLLELFCFDWTLPYDLPPAEWPRELLANRLRQADLARTFSYLCRPDLFALPEDERPSTTELAYAFGINVPPPVKRRSRPTTSTAGFRPRETALNSLLQSALRLLWFLCAAHWAVVSYKVSGWFISADSGLVPLGLRLVVAASLLLGGLYALSCLAFAEEQPQVVDIAGLRLEIPARENNGESEQGRRAQAALQLAGILAALAIAVTILVRFG